MMLAKPDSRLARVGRESTVLIARGRLSTLLLVFVAAFAVIGSRLADIIFLGLEARTSSYSTTTVTPAKRADIVDRNGVILARSFHAYTAGVHSARLITPRRLLATQIAAILKRRSFAEIYAAVTSSQNFHYLQRQIDPVDAVRLNALGDPGIEIGREPKRIYPQGPLASSIIGYSSLDGIGLAGIERYYNLRLMRPSTLDHHLQLSLDVRVEEVLEHELQAAVDRHSAKGAAGVILDVRTGEIVAMSSLPQFNPNDPASVPEEARFNRATLGVYELGSTFKAFTIAMALESGTLQSMANRYDATAPLRIGHFAIHDDHPKNRWLTVPEIFAYSSNIGAARIAHDLGAARQQHFLSQLGFLTPVHIELPERGHPLFPGNWGEIATMTVGFGHGIAVTPLHLATGYATLVNGGVWHPATLLKVQPGADAPGFRIFSERTSHIIRELMRLVVTSGTGGNADTHGYLVGGKTGTAEKPEGGRYNHHALISTFAGAFPMNNPRYVIVVTLDEPKGTKATFGFATGGWVAAPVVRNVVRAIGPMLGVYPDVTRTMDMKDVLPLMTLPKLPAHQTPEQSSGLPATL